MERNYFAGKFLLIPIDERPSSLQQPRMIAEVADHDLITPPSRLLGDVEKLTAWAKSVDYDDTDGAIISLDAVSGKVAPGNGRDSLELIKQIRSQRPGIPIYGSITLADSSNQIIQIADGLVAERLLDFLIISYRGNLRDGRQQTLLTKLKDEITLRKLSNRIAFNDGPDSATSTLLVRMINQRFGFAPRILPVYSSSAGRDSVVSGSSLPLHQLISDRIKKVGGIELQQTSQGARSVDLLLFIHSTQTRETERVALVETIAQTIDKNVRIAMVDLSETGESKDALMAELRRRKLLDKLSSYASSDPVNEGPGEALTRALVHSSSFIATIRFLRDDLDRVSRFDRAQVSLLLSRYLTDWAFPFHIRPKLQEQLNPESLKPGANMEAVEANTLNQMRPLADELFNEFKRNIHTFLLSNGERAQFEVRLMQRLLLRLYSRADSPQGVDAEIKPAVYIVYLGNDPVPQLRSQKLWELVTDGLDERIGRRWNAIDWPGFKTDGDSVAMAIKIASQSGTQLDLQQSYSIISKRSRNIRRIEITATTPQSAFYALGKLEQMGVNGQLAQDFQINEKPAIAQRGIIEWFSDWSHRDRMGLLRSLGRVRMNRYYYVPKNEAGWREGQTDREVEKVRELLRVADENFVQLVFGISPGPSISDLNDQNFISIGSRLDKLTSLGVRRFTIYFDNKPEKLQGSNSSEGVKKIISAQSRLINRVREHLKRSGDIELSVWPKLVAGTAFNLEYLKEISGAIAPDIQILFNSGTTDLNLSELAVRINRRPIIVTNVVDEVSEKWRMCLGPERANSSISDENSIGYLAAAKSQLQVTNLMIVKASERAWYGRSYDPDRAWDSALNLLYDERARAGVRAWSQLLGDCRSGKGPFEPLFNENDKQGRISGNDRELTEQKLAELQSALEAISGTRERGLLRGELAQFIERVQDTFQSSGVTRREEENTKQAK